MGREITIKRPGEAAFLVVDPEHLAIGTERASEQPDRTGGYAADTRYLRSLHLKIDDEEPALPLTSVREGAVEAGGDLPSSGARPALRVHRTLELSRDDPGTISSTATLVNLGPHTYLAKVSLVLDTDLRSMFAVRAAVQDNDPDRYRDEYDARRQVVLARPDPRRMTFSVDDIDGRRRVLDVGFNMPAAAPPGNPKHSDFTIALPPGEPATLVAHMRMREASIDGATGRPVGPWTTFAGASLPPPLHGVRVAAGDAAAAAVLNHAFEDYRSLSSTWEDAEGGAYRFQGAGMPWYLTLFGRDSLIAAIQILAYDPSIARDTLRLLARLQGTTFDPRSGEEPGKILHEARQDALARAGVVPYQRNYQSVDSTPLFLVALGEYVRRTGDLNLFHELRINVESALSWMATYGDHDRDGFLDYDWRGRVGLMQQGWKDSPRSVINTDGNVATPPIALVEVQGYAVWARRQMAQCYELAGMPGRAALLEQQADALLRRVLADFWMEDRNFFAMALQGEAGRPARERQVRTITSNPGHLLWAGILPQAYAQKVAERLMQPDMFSGWGIRTLSAAETLAYDPFSYHDGSIWTHDTSLIGAGMARHGFLEHVDKVFGALVDLALTDPQKQLPELTDGEARVGDRPPKGYQDTCKPQAWSAGSLPYLLDAALGLGTVGAAHRHLLRRLGEFIEVDGLPVRQRPGEMGSVRVDRARRKPSPARRDPRGLSEADLTR